MDDPASKRITTQEIIDAISTTLANAPIKGDPNQSKADEHIGPIPAILVRIGLDIRNAKDALKRKKYELTSRPKG
jgi:hypothetical protein